FTVLAAINAAGYDADLESPATYPIRKQIRELVASKKLASVEELKAFFAAHHQRDSTAEFSQYVSFALTIDGPPDFNFWLKDAELPPDVNALKDLRPLLARFYQEANLEDAWRRSQPAYERAIALYHGPVTQAIFQANAYLRNPTSGYLGRRFQIYIDLLGAPNQIQTRSYKDDYFVVVTPSPDPQIDDIRHAWLHYLLDPLSIKYSEQLTRIKPLADYAQAAPALDERYKNDLLLLTTESLIKAVESRLAAGDKRRKLVDDAMREGYVLTAAFAAGLPEFEKQARAMRLYFPELVEGISLKSEQTRLANYEFAKQPAIRVAPHSPEPPPPPLTGAAKILDDAQQLYASRDLEKARQAYLRVLEQTADRSLHAKAYYGLARIAALEKNPELAEKFFQKTLELSPDDDTRAWAHVYLGRLADASGDRDEAAKNYKAVLAVAGASAGARAAAEKGMKEAFKSK
ncbi:MAG: tetratricopeptide repeat protein, partial [Acidobacteriota bacterium]|nr:tetratricopeptide repeat protein [Acidobacteriota bacterium]